jgi:hypothetical protein
MERIKVIDPPQGWKYGFPKPIPDAVVNFRQWLIDNGYPERLIDEYGNHFYCRSWYQDAE